MLHGLVPPYRRGTESQGVAVVRENPGKPARGSSGAGNVARQPTWEATQGWSILSCIRGTPHSQSAIAFPGEADAGMAFQNWDRNFFYYRKDPFRTSRRYAIGWRDYPMNKLWQAMNWVRGGGVHYFHVAAADRDIANYPRMGFRSDCLIGIPLVQQN